MAAFRLDGGRVFYVEHECLKVREKKPDPRHLLRGHAHNSLYMVRMFYVGDLDVTRSSVNDFAYITDNVIGSGGTDAYVNCPLCGGEGRIVADSRDTVEIKESFGRSEAQESTFR